MADLPPIVARVEADLSKFEADMAELKRQLADVQTKMDDLAKGVTIPVRADIADAQAKMAQVSDEADALGEKRPTITVKADTTNARANMASAANQADALGRRVETIKIRVDTSDVDRAKAMIASSFGEGGGGGDGGAGIPGGSITPGDGGGGGGGGGTAALLAAAFMGRGGGRMPFTRGLLPALPAFGSIGALAGLGTTSALGAIGGLGLSAAGGAIGGGVLGLSALGTGAVGAGTNAAGMGQAVGDIKAVNQAYDNLAKAQAQFGAGSTQAAEAQNLVNFAMQSFNPVAASAVASAVQATQQFKTLFDQATGQAEKTGAEIITQAIQVGEKFIPTIGKFAAENMNILKSGLQPFFDWLQSTGLVIFTDLEKKFQGSFPTAIHAATQGFELFAKTIDFASNFIGGFLPKIDAFVTKWNGAQFGQWTDEIQRLIGLFHTWANFVTELGRVFIQIGKDFAGTGTSIIELFTQMLTKLHDYLATAQGATALHAVFEGHKAALLAVLQALEPLAVVMAKLELTVVPALAQSFALLIRAVTPLLNLLAGNPFTAFLLGLGLIELKTHAITTAFGLVKAAISAAFGVVNFGQTLAAWLGVGAAAQTSATEINTAGARAVAGGNEFAAAGARAEQGSFGFLSEGAAAGTAATEIDVAGARAAEGGAGFAAAGAEAETGGGGLLRFSNMTKLLTGGGGGLVELAAVLGVALVGFAGFWKATHTWNDEALVSQQNARNLGVSVDELNSRVQQSTGPTKQYGDNLNGVRAALANTVTPTRDSISNTQQLKDAINGVAPSAQDMQNHLVASSNTLAGLQKILGLSKDQMHAFATDAGITSQQLASAQGPEIFKQKIAAIASGAQAADPIVRQWAGQMITQLNNTGTAAAQNQTKFQEVTVAISHSFETWANTVGTTTKIATQDVNTATAEMERQWTLMGNQTLENTAAWSQQMHGEFSNAMRLVDLEMANGGRLSVSDLANALHIGEPEVIQILNDFKLQFQGTSSSIAQMGNLAGFGFATGANSEMLKGLGPLVQTLGGYDQAIAAGLDPLLAAIGQRQIEIKGIDALGLTPQQKDSLIGSSLNLHPAASGATIGHGFTTNGPQAIVGEGNPGYPEYVIPTDPAHRGNAKALYGALGKQLGGMAAGGCAGCSGDCAGGCGKARGGILGMDTGGIMDAFGPVLAPLIGSPDGGGTGGGSIPQTPVPPGAFGSGADVPKPPSDFLRAFGSYGNTDNSLAMVVYQGAVRIADAAAAARAAAAAGAGIGGSGPAVTGQCADWINQGLALAGGTARMSASCLMGRAMNESGCNPGARNNWDSNAAAGHPSVGLMQFVPSTFAANSVAGCNDIMNPICQVAASAHCDPGNCGHGGYGCKAGGFLGSSLHQMPVNSFDTGGFLPTGASIAMNHTGKPERVGGGDTYITVEALTNANAHDIAHEISWAQRTMVAMSNTYA